MTPDTLRFLRSLCDQVKIDPPLTNPEARLNAARLWQAADELDAALATTPAANGAAAPNPQETGATDATT